MKKQEKKDLFINKLYDSIKDEKDLSKCVYIIAKQTKGIKAELTDYIFSIFPIEKNPTNKKKELLKWTKEFKQKMFKLRFEKKNFKKELQNEASYDNKKLLNTMVEKGKLEIITPDLSKF